MKKPTSIDELIFMQAELLNDDEWYLYVSPLVGGRRFVGSEQALKTLSRRALHNERLWGAFGPHVRFDDSLEGCSWRFEKELV